MNVFGNSYFFNNLRKNRFNYLIVWIFMKKWYEKNACLLGRDSVPITDQKKPRENPIVLERTRFFREYLIFEREPEKDDEKEEVERSRSQLQAGVVVPTHRQGAGGKPQCWQATSYRDVARLWAPSASRI